jgi:hypothetical protein
MSAHPDKADLAAWVLAMPGDDPRLEALEAIRRGEEPEPEEEALLSLKELADALGFKHYTALHKLKIQRVGESWGGGRLRYRRSRAEAYLRSPECLAVREELRRRRREREGVKA